jgi:signal recognition particle subunit SEC65
LRSAAERLGLNAAVQEARRPSSGRLTGYIQVTKFGRKADLIKKLSAELGRLRSEFRRDEGAQKALPRR